MIAGLGSALRGRGIIAEVDTAPSLPLFRDRR